MRWQIKKEPYIPYGAFKEKTCFALFPVQISGQWVWLERYVEVYVNVSHSFTVWAFQGTHLREKK